MTGEEARSLALAQAGAVEMDHHGRPSFRVGGRIFATLWDARHMNVMVDHAAIMDAVDAHPGVCEEMWWGQRLAAVRVDLAAAPAALLTDLLGAARDRKAEGRRRPPR